MKNVEHTFARHCWVQQRWFGESYIFATPAHSSRHAKGPLGTQPSSKGRNYLNSFIYFYCGVHTFNLLAVILVDYGGDYAPYIFPAHMLSVALDAETILPIYYQVSIPGG